MKTWMHKLVHFVWPVVAVFAVTVLLLLLIGVDLAQAFRGFFYGLFGNTFQIGEIFVKSTPLLLAGLGCSIGFHCGFINLGAEGQLYIGALASSVVAIFLGDLPPAILIPLMFAAGFIAGGIWAFIPGIMKAKYGLSEVIMSIMFNYIAIQLIALSIRTWIKDPDYPFPMSSLFAENACLPLLIPHTRLHVGFVMALVFAALVYLFLWKTARGFQIRACGCNPRASFCVGVNVNRNIILSSLLSGGFAGIAGFVEVAGVQHRLIDGLSSNYGYLAIMVALLGNNHPAGVVVTAVLLGALDIGGLAMQRQAGVPTSLTTVILGIIIVVFLLRNHYSKRIKEA